MSRLQYDHYSGETILVGGPGEHLTGVMVHCNCEACSIKRQKRYTELQLVNALDEAVSNSKKRWWRR